LVSEREKRSYTTREQMMEDFQNENIKLLCGLNAITIKKMEGLNAITIKKMEDNQRINSAKFDKMIALLEKIAGE
jgi:GTP cyclohydrolase II